MENRRLKEKKNFNGQKFEHHPPRTMDHVTLHVVSRKREFAIVCHIVLKNGNTMKLVITVKWKSVGKFSIYIISHSAWP